jgi:hypothetical protein
VIPPEPTTRAWTAKDDKELQTMVARGDNHKSIAAALARPLTSIRSRLVTLGISRHEARKSQPPAPASEAVARSSEFIRPGVRIITHRLL